METPEDGYHTEGTDDMTLIHDEDGQYQSLSDNEMSHEILRMIINSVQKRERRKSAKKQKRKRSTISTSEPNGSEADDERKAYSRCSIKYLSKVLDKVRSCPHYVELVKWLGFAEILNLDNCCVPRCFVQWVADNVCTDAEVIAIGSKQIQLSPQTVHESLGTPTGDLLVDSDEELGKAAFLAIFGLTEVPTIKFFGKLILAKEILPDSVFCRCFMSVCLGTFFCPNSSTKISTKYMGALVVVDKIRYRNWSKFIHEWMMFYIKKYLKEPATARQLTQTLGGCIYHLAVRCLDFIDFTPIQIPSTMPRIRVWKGNLIKVFSDMFLGTNGKYGAYPVKDIFETCYYVDPRIDSQQGDSDAMLKKLIGTAIGDLVGAKLKDDISTTFLTIMKDEDMKFCMKAQDLVTKVIEAILLSQNGSQNTVKISDSQECSYKTAIDSQSTLKLTQEDDDFQDDDDEDDLIPRKKRRTEENTNSDTLEQNEYARKIDTNPDCTEATHILSPLHEKTTGNKAATSQIFPSASLDYMIHAKDPQHTNEGSVYVSSEVFDKFNKLNDTKGESIMDLNVKCIEEENDNFHGFDAPPLKDIYIKSIEGENIGFPGLDAKVIEHDQSEDRVQGVVPDNRTLPPDESCAMEKELNANHQNNQITAVSLKRSEYLEIARSKYFFKDESTPSFRLMECVDDNGTTIEEPELFRPLEIDNYSYNAMCELAILKCKLEENLKEKENNVQTVESENANITPNRSVTRNYSNNNRSVENIQNDYESSIQCAQRQTSKTGLTKTPTRPPRQQNFVDLVSPVIPMTSLDRVNLEQFSSSNPRTTDYGKTLIVGRRLFEGNDEDYNDSNSKNIRIAKELINNFGNESPPEVQIMGEKSFKYTSNIMSQETDELYNTSLSLGNSTSRNGKENCLPKRIPLRSKYICSPYDVNPSQSVFIEPFEQKIWQAVTILCDHPVHKFDWAVNIDSVRVKMLQLGNSMKLEGWLEAWLMNAFCRKLFRDNHPSKTKKHFFFNTISDFFLEKWKSEESKIIWNKRAIESFTGANKAYKLHLSDGLYFPTIYNRHWFVFLVDIKYHNFIFLDSFFGEESTFHKTIADLMINNFQKTWHEAGLKQMNFQNNGRAYPNVPKQTTGNDCGIFAMKYMELYVPRNQAKCNFSPLDIPLFRVKYTHDILLSRHNMEHDAKDLVSMFEL